MVKTYKSKCASFFGPPYIIHYYILFLKKHVSGGALNSTHSLTPEKATILTFDNVFVKS